MKTMSDTTRESVKILVHQTLHGYDNGHQMLAGSIRLSRQDQVMLDRLSDLSGPLLELKSFKPYYTAFPLPSGEYYAVCKTWIDDQEIRRGSVVSHTIILSVADYKEIPELEIILGSFLYKPDKKKTHEYSKPLEIIYNPAKPKDIAGFDLALGHRFVKKYFESGLKPILWLDVPDPPAVACNLVNGLWPSLRAKFAFCTFSLKIRHIGDKPFDLLFAPSSRRRKHLPTSDQNVLTYRPSQAINMFLSEHQDDCTVQFAKHLFSSESDAMEFRVRFDDLWDSIDSNSGNFKFLCRLSELINRREVSGEATIGILDLATMLAPLGSEAVGFKQKIMIDELENLETKNDEEALETLYRIATRCEKPAFTGIALSVRRRIEHLIGLLTMEMPENALSIGHEILFDDRAMHSLYLKGLTAGLNALCTSNPDRIFSIDYEMIYSPNILALAPNAPFVHYSNARATSGSHRLELALSDSIGQLHQSHKHEVRKLFLVGALASIEYELVNSLISDIREEYVFDTLDLVAERPSVLSQDQIRALFVDSISKRYPEPVLRWWRESSSSEYWMAGLVANSVSTNTSGLQELISVARGDREQAFLTSWFISRFSVDMIPEWLTQTLKESGSFELMLSHALEEPNLQDSILLVAKGSEALPLGADSSAFKLVETYHSSPIFDDLAHGVVEIAVRSFLSSSISSDEFKGLISSQVGKHWIGKSGNQKIASTILEQSHITGVNMDRLWRLLEVAPEELYGKRSGRYEGGNHPFVIVIGQILDSQSDDWLNVSTEHWLSIIQRARSLHLNSLDFSLSEQAVKFALRHPEFPLNTIVRETFSTVYRAQKEVQFPWSIMSYMFGVSPEINKKRELRTRIVEAFLKSDWPLAELAQAMPDMETFRQVVILIKRQKGGKRILNEIRKQLAKDDGTIVEGFIDAIDG